MMQAVCGTNQVTPAFFRDSRSDGLRRKSFEGSSCSVARSLDVIGDWWSLLIIRDAFSGLRRFGEFQRNLGLAKNILTTRLKSLVARGILEVVPASDGSAYKEYVLTEKGRGLLPVIVALGQWGGEFLFEPGEARTTHVDATHRHPLRKLEVRSADGVLLRFQDVTSVRSGGTEPAASARQASRSPRKSRA
jgi:DNA-binding HxlR family transcriptional regulator